MTTSLVAGAVGTANVPELVRGLSSLADIDYIDHFTLATDADASPEQWARAMFGDVPSLGQQLIWRGLLQLRGAEREHRRAGLAAGPLRKRQHRAGEPAPASSPSPATACCPSTSRFATGPGTTTRSPNACVAWTTAAWGCCAK